MAEVDLDDGENALIHTLPYETMRDLSRILDVGETWIELATRMPEISTQDVEGCRQFGASHRGSPSEYLLRVWASKGYSILSLYNLFAMTRMVRCMRIIRHLVSESHHYLEDYALSNEDLEDPLSSQNFQQCSRIQHASISSLKRTEPQHASQLPSVSTQKSSTVLSTSETSSSGNITDPLWSAFQNTLTVPYAELLVIILFHFLACQNIIVVLLAATSNFADDNVLGKGGYGVVYVGEWKHTKIAVKRFTSTGNKSSHIQRERLRQSLQELRTLAKYRHDNILPLYAFSIEGPEPCLVYQFMSNGSLEDRLLCRRGSAPLSWLQKKEIAEGTARGLHFLHCIASTPIIHGDVKSANILLDRHFEPKLGDFGLSRDGRVETDTDQRSPLIASHVKGTLAYLPPEFITSKILSTKLDVYSFGIVLLEIGTGLRAYLDSRSPPGLADYCYSAKNSTKNSNWVEALMDKRTPLPVNQGLAGVAQWFNGLICLGLQCVEKDRHMRPSFPEIVMLLAEHSTKFVPAS